ncbi:hypothetical protein CA850_12500 [Micromonospora echinospora]|uniref:Uncharacterized protein n=1 Tax=Micromonospora echinospora TaxID=1877 RepID=A0A1C4U8W6_MICEC|nr:hypothetical protein [Micromonospora echinospora]OZV80973.1 hypothetical protein CA850_12500 [Micromonospora echinospora]SCE68135.1 hypothetical protein GA0070618_0118 [Micromonospora echinospora]
MTTTGENAEAATVTAGRQPRVLLLSFNLRPHERVIALAENLIEQGALVDVLVMDDQGWQDVIGRPNLRVHSLDGAERRHLVMRAERVAVFRGPGAVLSGLGKLTGQRPVRPLVRGHEKLAGAFHRRVFMKSYAAVRPMVLSRLFERRLPDLGIDRVDAIIASDMLTVTLGWKLAKRFPNAVATTSLDPPVLTAER